MVISLASRSASRIISSNDLRRTSARSRGLRAAQPSKASLAASTAAFASSTVAFATDAILFSVAGSSTSKRPPSKALRHLPPIHRSVGTLARRLSYRELMVTSYLLRIQRLPDPLCNSVDGRQRQILQNVGRRQWNVWGGDPHRRAVKIVEGLIRHDRDDLGAPSAKPRILLDREQPVRTRNGTKDGLSVEGHQRTHIHDFAVDPVFGCKLLRRLDRPRHHQRKREDGRILPRAHDLGGAKPVEQLAIRHLALGRVKRFVLEEDDGVRIAHGRRQQADDVARRRGRNNFETGNHHRPILDALRMLRAKPGARAVGGAHHQRAFDLAVRHVTALADLVGDVIEAYSKEIREHDLGNRLQPSHGGAHRGPKDGLLGDRAIAHALWPELLEKPYRRLEHASRLGAVLADDD